MVTPIVSNLAFSVISVFGVIFGVMFVFFGLRESQFVIFVSGFLILLSGAASIGYLLSKK